jgi:hypothetical protein
MNDECDRCIDMTREQLCNELGHYRCAVFDIKAFVDGEMPHKTLADVVAEALATLKEALDEAKGR